MIINNANRVSLVLCSFLLLMGCKLSVVPDVQKVELRGNVGEIVSSEFELTNDYDADVELIVDELPSWIRIPALETSSTLTAGQTKKFNIQAQCRDGDITYQARVFVTSVPGSAMVVNKEIVVHLLCDDGPPIGRIPQKPTPPEPNPNPPEIPGTLYVSPSGRDSGAGSQEDPFETLSRALQVAAAGDVIVVGDGVYPAENATYGLWVNVAGTPDRPIRIVAENRHGAIIDGAGDTHYGVTFGADASYVSFEGFDIRGFQDGAFFTQEAQQLNLAGNILHHIGRGCSDSQYGRSGIYLGKKARNITIDSNIIHTIGRYSPGEQGCRPETHYWQNHDHGVYIKASDVTIVNNVFYKMERGWAIHGWANDLDNVKVLNNTFLGPNPDRSGHILLAGDYKFTNWVIQNNVFENPNGKAISVSCEKVSDMKVQGNISTAPLASDMSCFEGSQNLQNTSSIVEDQGGYVLPPRASSRACDIAVTSGAPTYDIDGRSRPANGMCAGAYQR